MSLTLETIYKAILETGWLVTNEKGEVDRKLSAAADKDAKNEPFILLEKRVALPTRDNLNRSGRDNLLIFHPLMEGLVGGESPVIGKLRRAYGIRSTVTGLGLFKFMLSGATHTTEYNKFSPEQMKLFKALSDISEKTLKQWDKISRMAIEKHGASNAFADVYTKRNAMLNGQPYSRVTLVRFPIYEELVRSDKLIFGKDIALSVSDRANFVALFEFIFPGIEEKDSYSKGTNSRIAPYLDALLKAFGTIFTNLNSIYDLYSPVIVMDENVRVELDWPDWFEEIESLKTLAQAVPQQYGNYAVKVEDEKRENTGTSFQGVSAEVATSSPNEMTFVMEPPVVFQGGIGGGQQRTTGYDQIPPVKMPVYNGVDQPHLQTKFNGIGKPLSEANGIVPVKDVNLDAVIISNSQSRVMVDPVKASIDATLELVRHGGVGRVSASATHTPQLAAMGPVFGSAQMQNNMQSAGWANSALNNNTNTQNSNVSAAMVMRELALKRLTSNPSPFNDSGLMSRGSVV